MQLMNIRGATYVSDTMHIPFINAQNSSIQSELRKVWYLSPYEKLQQLQLQKIKKLP